MTRRRTMLDLKNALWPDVYFYDKQIEIIESVERNNETYVTAGNKLGKDYVAAFICLSSFLLYEEVRILTTSVEDRHLGVLWDEIGRFIGMSKFPLDHRKNGPLIINDRLIRKVYTSGPKKGERVPVSYMRGIVCEDPEKMAGHHAKDFTMAVVDEASSLDDKIYEQFQGWAKRMLFIGNPNPCNNQFKKAVKAGDVLAA